MLYTVTTACQIKGLLVPVKIAPVRVLEKCGFVQTYQGPGKYQGRESEIIIALWKNKFYSVMFFI